MGGGETATGTCSSPSGCGDGEVLAVAVVAAAAAGGQQVAQGGQGKVRSIPHFQSLPALNTDRFNHQPIYGRDQRFMDGAVDLVWQLSYWERCAR